MKTAQKKDCCEKCYHDIENGVVFTLVQCRDCSCHNSSQEDWETEFDAVLETVDSPENYYNHVKSFIRTNRTALLKEIEEKIERLPTETVLSSMGGVWEVASKKMMGKEMKEAVLTLIRNLQSK